VPNGQEWFEATFKDGKQHGPVTGWYGWYKNGQKEYEYEFTFKVGKLHGRYTEWYENGQKREETTRKAGKILSRKKWDEDGILTKEKTVNKADSHGLETHWHRNGQKSSERTWKNFKLISSKEWDEDGNSR